MKRINRLLLLLALLLSITGCGSSAEVNLQSRSPVPEDGLLSAQLLEQLRDENAIAIFEGTSNGLAYEWTIFGSDIKDARDIDLRLTIVPSGEGVQVSFSEKDPFGFPALLSIRLKEKWEADTAYARQDNGAPCPISLTGTKTTILNLSIRDHPDCITILPDKSAAETPETGHADESPNPPDTPQVGLSPEVPEPDDYLSDTAGGDRTVYENVAENEEAPETPAEQDEYLSDVKDTQGTPQTGFTEKTLEEAPANNPPEKEEDLYLSAVEGTSNRVYSDGSGSGKDQYLTDPVPAGKPMPVEPEDTNVNGGKTYTCTFSIECTTILNNLDQLYPDKLEMVPSGGVILPAQTVMFYEGESVFDVLQRVCRENKIHLESSWTPIYNSAYVEGIHNLYEFDCGSLSGWMYRVNGWYPNYGCSRYQLAEGDVVEWRYTCDLGKDVGGKNLW